MSCVLDVFMAQKSIKNDVISEVHINNVVSDLPMLAKPWKIRSKYTSENDVKNRMKTDVKKYLENHLENDGQNDHQTVLQSMHNWETWLRPPNISKPIKAIRKTTFFAKFEVRKVPRKCIGNWQQSDLENDVQIDLQNDVENDVEKYIKINVKNHEFWRPSGEHPEATRNARNLTSKNVRFRVLLEVPLQMPSRRLRKP